MSVPKIKKLDETVVNRIAAGEIIQRPANALKELLENSLDAKSTNIQITVKDGGLKLLQIQDNGTGIRKEDLDIVCERFTTSKLQAFEDLQSISTYGFRGEALASISHVAQLTITTKTADEKCAYKASYTDSKLKKPPEPCAGNQGTIITVENLFYNVATRRKALSNTSEEFAKIVDVVTKYAVHNPTVGFTLKKHGDVKTQLRTPHSSTKMSNIRILYGNPIARELLEIILDDGTYKFKFHALITNPNYSSKKMVFLLFINHRLVESSSLRKMLEDLYSVYLPTKTHPWCYLSLEINPANVDVNIHPTKHEVKFLHEDIIIEKIKHAFEERLSVTGASRTFYIQNRLPAVDLTEDALKEVLPGYNKNSADKSKKPQDMVRTDSTDQKLDRFNFTISSFSIKNKKSSLETHSENTDGKLPECKKKDQTDHAKSMKKTEEDSPTNFKGHNIEFVETPEIKGKCSTNMDIEDQGHNVVEEDIVDKIQEKTRNMEYEEDEEENENVENKKLKRVTENIEYKEDEEENENIENKKNEEERKNNTEQEDEEECERRDGPSVTEKITDQHGAASTSSQKLTRDLESYCVNNFRREVKLRSVLELRKEVEDNYHEGLREILSNLIFVGCVDEKYALVQSGVNLYICNTEQLAYELFYEIMLYNFANHGLIKFSEPLPLYDLAMLGLETKEAGWKEDCGSKEELSENAKELLLEKADMLREYFSIVIDKYGNLKSLPILIENYFPCGAEIPLFILRLATEVDWQTEKPCFENICRETARLYSRIDMSDDEDQWKHVTEHIIYHAIKESLLPPKQFAHDSTILKITSLPELYKIFERC